MVLSMKKWKNLIGPQPQNHLTAFVDLAPVDPAPVDPAPVDAATAKPSARKSSSFVKFAKISGLVLSGLVGVAGVAGGVFALTNAAMAGQVCSQVLSVSVASDALMWGAIGAVALGALAMVGVGIAAGKMAEAARSDSTNFTAAVIALSMLEAATAAAAPAAKATGPNGGHGVGVNTAAADSEALGQQDRAHSADDAASGQKKPGDAI